MNPHYQNSKKAFIHPQLYCSYPPPPFMFKNVNNKLYILIIFFLNPEYYFLRCTETFKYYNCVHFIEHG